MGIDLERYGRVGMAQLSRHVHDIETASDEHAGLPVSKGVQRQPTVSSSSRPTDGLPERFADVAVVAPATGRRGEDEIVGTLERRGQPLVSEEPDHGRGEFDLATTGLGLERSVVPPPCELAMDVEGAGVEVHIAPSQSQPLADAEPGEGEQLEQRTVRACMVEHPSEVGPFEDGDLAGTPARLFGGFQQADRIGGQPAPADGKPKDLRRVNRTMLAVVLASTRSLAADQSATVSTVSSDRPREPMATIVLSVERSMWRRTTRS
jgi:hypothetical protein